MKTIYADDGVRGIEIFERPDGLFAYANIRLVDIPTVGPRWRRVGMGRSLYETAEIAEREARASVTWLVGN